MNNFGLDWSEFTILQEFCLSGCLSSVDNLRTLKDIINLNFDYKMGITKSKGCCFVNCALLPCEI